MRRGKRAATPARSLRNKTLVSDGGSAKESKGRRYAPSYSDTRSSGSYVRGRSAGTVRNGQILRSVLLSALDRNFDARGTRSGCSLGLRLGAGRS